MGTLPRIGCSMLDNSVSADATAEIEWNAVRGRVPHIRIGPVTQSLAFVVLGLGIAGAALLLPRSSSPVINRVVLAFGATGAIALCVGIAHSARRKRAVNDAIEALCQRTMGPDLRCDGNARELDRLHEACVFGVPTTEVRVGLTPPGFAHSIALAYLLCAAALTAFGDGGIVVAVVAYGATIVGGRAFGTMCRVRDGVVSVGRVWPWQADVKYSPAVSLKDAVVLCQLHRDLLLIMARSSGKERIEIDLRGTHHPLELAGAVLSQAVAERRRVG